MVSMLIVDMSRRIAPKRKAMTYEATFADIDEYYERGGQVWRSFASV